MVKITYIEANGDEEVVEARVGQSVMEAAVKSGVRGITADCGGSCACATCRVHVPEEWWARLGEASEMELAMIEFSGDPEPRTRLSCQITVTQDLDGIVLHLPESQHF